MSRPTLDFQGLYDNRKGVHEYQVTGVAYDCLQWSLRQFPGERHEATLEHLRREVEELLADPTSAEEYADVFMLLNRAAHNAGVNLTAAVDAKLVINRRRQWGQPDEHGVVEHIREEAE